MRTIRTVTLFVLLLICAHSSFASVEYVSSEIDTSDNRQGYWTADMNGDLLQDVLIATWSESNGREFLIYTQEANGKFSGSPWRRIEIKKDIVAFALADLRSTPGSELLFFTGAACYSMSCTKESYAGNLKKIFEWELIKSVPDKKKIDFMGNLKDLNDDGFVDIIVPGQDQYALFTGQPNEVFLKQSTLPKPDVIVNKSNRDENSFTIGTTGVSSGGDDIYSNLLIRKLEPESVYEMSYPPILNYKHWIPVLSTGRFNLDKLDDFIFLDDIHSEKKNTKRFNLIFQSGTGEFSKSQHWQANIIINDGVKMMDVNGDSLTDLLTKKMEKLNTTVYFFLNQDGRFNFDTPDHVMKLTGILSNFQAIDFNQDGFPELVINTYSASPVKTMTSGSIERKLIIFAGRKHDNENAVFDRKPVFTYEEKITPSNFKSLTSERSFSGDIDGDGVNDMISVDHTGALIANRISHDLKLETEPFLRFIPMHYIQDNRLVELNQDDRTDIILEHKNGLSIIISMQGAQR